MGIKRFPLFALFKIIIVEEASEVDFEEVEAGVSVEVVSVEVEQVADGNIKKYKSILFLVRVSEIYREII